MLADIGTCLVPILSGRIKASVIREATSAASAASRFGRITTNSSPPRRPSQALGKLDQQFVAGRMSERVVDVLEIIDVEKRQRDMFAGGTGLDRFGDQSPQVRTIWQAGQQIIIRS